eukprot:CAMPEP_0183356230 /NCGR_PEP_ID=MMETSP0164_2-20130417/43654_1 /TAXON_ID=221442 /ORGANISM="Coccolithus pelagicus ssp braarudi, Strain PLY182g" /LENGTH=74 /DNA_ID=CAMNT_0025529577 /DNA_START=173 /DNA_END=397 /DNA_ORIENTATION=-
MSSRREPGLEIAVLLMPTPRIWHIPNVGPRYAVTVTSHQTRERPEHFEHLLLVLLLVVLLVDQCMRYELSMAMG